MNPAEELIAQLRSMLDDKDVQIRGLIAERDGLRAINREYQAQQTKDNNTISELLAENIELHNKLDGAGLA